MLPDYAVSLSRSVSALSCSPDEGVALKGDSGDGIFMPGVGVYPVCGHPPLVGVQQSESGAESREDGESCAGEWWGVESWKEEG